LGHAVPVAFSTNTFPTFSESSSVHIARTGCTLPRFKMQIFYSAASQPA